MNQYRSFIVALYVDLCGRGRGEPASGPQLQPSSKTAAGSGLTARYLEKDATTVREESRVLRDKSSTKHLLVHPDLKLSLSDWSFSQLCKPCEVHKETVNKLSKETVSLVFRDAMPRSRKPLQVYSADDIALARAWHDLLAAVRRRSAPGCSRRSPRFHAAAQGIGEATGLYAGEQDMFAFGIDPNAWVEIGGESFAPGFFVWNSEVGRRSVGVQTFWFQHVCQNHIVWDAIEVVEVTRRHMGNIQDALFDIRAAISQLVNKRDERRDAFAKGMKLAMDTTLGQDADEVHKVLGKHGVSFRLAEQALQLAGPQASYSVFAIVDALTRIAGRYENAGDRLALDQKAATLLSLAA